MKSANKYRPIYEYLSRRQAEQVNLTFDEIEGLLGQALPPSARRRRDWWGNRRNSQHASAWMDAGYHATEVDLQTGRVTFAHPVLHYEVRREGDTVLWNSEMVKALRLHLGLTQNQLAEQLGMRQQTISEWETGLYAPSRATSKYLSLVAERAGFAYDE